MSRLIEQVENSDSLVRGRRTTRFTYRPDDQIETVTLAMRSGENQTTRYLYGTTLGTSDVATGNLQTGIVAPDGARTSLAYNRQGQIKQMTDPNGNVHRYEFDGLGRMRADQIVEFGRFTDRGVQRIQWDFDKHGRLEEVTSFAAGGKPVNGVRYWYTPLGMIRAESQNHFKRADATAHLTHQIIAKAFDSLGKFLTNQFGPDPYVEYRFEETSLNEPRLHEMIYPGIISIGDEDVLPENSRRCLHYRYDSAREVNDALNRVHRIERSHADGEREGPTDAKYL